MPTWPASLPQRPLVREYTETPPDVVRRKPMSVGPDKIERKYANALRRIACVVGPLTPAQKTTLENLYRTETERGALWFDWLHPRTQEAAPVKFLAPPSYSPGGASLTFARLSLGLGLGLVPLTESSTAFLWDFSTSLPAGLTLTRESTQTYRTSGALLATASSGAFAAHYKDDLAFSGLLAESSIEMASAITDDFGVWVKANATVGNSVTGPSGASDAFAIRETVTDGNHQVRRANITREINDPWTFGVWAKRVNNDWLALLHGGAFRLWVDLNNVVAGTIVDNDAYWIESWGNGWYRISMAQTSLAQIDALPIIRTAPTEDAASYAGNTANGVNLFGPSFRQEAFPTSYHSGTRATTTCSASFDAITPAAIGVRGVTAMGVESGVDQVFCEMTGSGTSIKVFRRASDRHLLVEWTGGGSYDAGLIADNTGFDLAIVLTAAPSVNAITFGTDAANANHWCGIVQRVEIE